MKMKKQEVENAELVILKLKRILKEGRKASRAGKKDETKKLFEQGSMLAAEAGFPDDAKVFQASSLISDKNYDEALSLLNSVIERPINLLGQAWDRIGLAYIRKKEYDTAIDCFHKALQSPDYDAPGNAWNNMGNAYAKKNEFDKAIECYQKALDSPNYNTPGNAWNNVGNAYAKKNEFDKAIDCFQKAIDSPNYDTLGLTWYNMGLSFWSQGNIERSINIIEKAISALEKEKDTANLRVASDTLAFLKKKERAERKGLSKLAQEYDDVVHALQTKAKPGGEELSPYLRRLIKRAGAATTAYTEYAKQHPSNYMDALIVLKGWSSAMPIIASVSSDSFGGQPCRGGGYFIKASNHGIILDPGYDYLRNFRSVDLHIKEVNAVIVTHNHPDHQDDLTRIADLDYEYRKNVQGAAEYSKIHYYLDPDTNRAFARNLEALNADKDLITQVDTMFPYWPIKEGFSFTPFKTEHGDGEVVARPFGLVLSLKLSDGSTCRVGYTSDTKYMPDIANALESCDILICHFSSAKSEEFRDSSRLHDSHLGFNGLRNMVENTHARLYIISEFWGGVGDQRYDLVEYLKNEFAEKGRKDLKILAGDIGLIIDLKTLGVICSGCRKVVSYEDIRTVEPSDPFDMLRFYCTDCPTGMPKKFI
jgi:tetratricopeptide (TPR) repeat protein